MHGVHESCNNDNRTVIMPRVIAITSGKGGVGKSNFAINVGIALAMMDNRVQILDADLGLANLDILLGIRPQKTLEDVVLGHADIRDIVIQTDYRIEIIPGSSGQQSMANLKADRLHDLIGSIMEVSSNADFLIVDTGAGISSTVIAFLMALKEVVVGVTPEPTSLTDAYSLIKVLNNNGFDGKIDIFASMTTDIAMGRTIHKKISSAAQRFLNIPIGYLGCVCKSSQLPMAVKDQVPVIVRFPSSEIARSYRILATKLLGHQGMVIDHEKFWSRLLKMLVTAAPTRKVRTISFNGDSTPDPFEKTIHDILDEQRRTRLLLERLVSQMDQDAVRAHKNVG